MRYKITELFSDIEILCLFFLFFQQKKLNFA